MNFNISKLNSEQLNFLNNVKNLHYYINSIQQIKSTDNTTGSAQFDSLQVEKYANALKELDGTLTALLLSTQGVNNETILQTLAAKDLTLAEQSQSMVEAGLLKARESITAQELQSAFVSTLNSDGKAEELMTTLGLTAALEGEDRLTEKVVKDKIVQAIVEKKLTNEQAKATLATFGMSSAEVNLGIVTDSLTTKYHALKLSIGQSASAMLSFLTTNPAGWSILTVSAIAAVTAGVYAYNKSIDKAVDNAKEKLSNTESALSDIVSRLEETRCKLSELEALEVNGRASVLTFRTWHRSFRLAL